MKTVKHSRRSVLSAPGDQWELLVKQQSAPCDVVMIDLEHAVHKDRKGEALDNCARALRTLNHAASEVIVRVNDPHGGQFEADIRALCRNAPHSYLIPKVADADDAIRVAEAIQQIEAESGSDARSGLWFLVESPGAVLHAETIARLPRTEALLLGHGDLEHSVGFLNQGWTETPALDFARNMMVFAAAAGGVDAIDGAITGFADAERVEAQARHSARMGMAGALIVSPRQIAPVHSGFRPSDAEIERAQRIVTAFSEAWKEGSGVAVVEGHFVDDVLAVHAREVLRRAGMTGAALDLEPYRKPAGSA